MISSEPDPWLAGGWSVARPCRRPSGVPTSRSALIAASSLWCRSTAEKLEGAVWSLLLAFSLFESCGLTYNTPPPPTNWSMQTVGAFVNSKLFARPNKDYESCFSKWIGGEDFVVAKSGQQYGMPPYAFFFGRQLSFLSRRPKKNQFAIGENASVFTRSLTQMFICTHTHSCTAFLVISPLGGFGGPWRGPGVGDDMVDLSQQFSTGRSCKLQVQCSFPSLLDLRSTEEPERIFPVAQFSLSSFSRTMHAKLAYLLKVSNFQVLATVHADQGTLVWFSSFDEIVSFFFRTSFVRANQKQQQQQQKKKKNPSEFWERKFFSSVQKCSPYFFWALSLPILSGKFRLCLSFVTSKSKTTSKCWGQIVTLFQFCPENFVFFFLPLSFVTSNSDQKDYFFFKRHKKKSHQSGRWSRNSTKTISVGLKSQLPTLWELFFNWNRKFKSIFPRVGQNFSRHRLQAKHRLGDW